jgi:hypothetical protein
MGENNQVQTKTTTEEQLRPGYEKKKKGTAQGKKRKTRLG